MSIKNGIEDNLIVSVNKTWSDDRIQKDIAFYHKQTCVGSPVPQLEILAQWNVAETDVQTACPAPGLKFINYQLRAIIKTCPSLFHNIFRVKIHIKDNSHNIKMWKIKFRENIQHWLFWSCIIVQRGDVTLCLFWKFWAMVCVEYLMVGRLLVC